MLRPETYEKLHKACRNRGLVLINDPHQYRYCHYLPESYSGIEAHTPKTVWLETSYDHVDFEVVARLIEPFGASPLVVKDFVKSQKHRWEEACFIPDASDRAQVERVVRRFVELQGTDLAGGVRAFGDPFQVRHASCPGVPAVLPGG